MKNQGEKILSDTLLEKNLDRFLSPVKPQDNFIRSLNQRLRNRPAVTVEYPEIHYLIIIMGTGLFFGMFLFWILLKLKSYRKSENNLN